LLILFAQRPLLSNVFFHKIKKINKMFQIILTALLSALALPPKNIRAGPYHVKQTGFK
jgi:hypothetical protein